MKSPQLVSELRLFRVWLTRYEGRRPRRWSDVPRGAKAVEPADLRCVPFEAAREFVAGFNRARRNDNLWAVAVPVVIRVDGDPRPGKAIDRARTLRGERKKNPSRVCQKSTLDGLIPRDSF